MLLCLVCQKVQSGLYVMAGGMPICRASGMWLLLMCSRRGCWCRCLVAVHSQWRCLTSWFGSWHEGHLLSCWSSKPLLIACEVEAQFAKCSNRFLSSVVLFLTAFRKISASTSSIASSRPLCWVAALVLAHVACSCSLCLRCWIGMSSVLIGASLCLCMVKLSSSTAPRQCTLYSSRPTGPLATCCGLHLVVPSEAAGGAGLNCSRSVSSW